jgi:hypothetical protein
MNVNEDNLLDGGTVNQWSSGSIMLFGTVIVQNVRAE